MRQTGYYYGNRWIIRIVVVVVVVVEVLETRKLHLKILHLNLGAAVRHQAEAKIGDSLTETSHLFYRFYTCGGSNLEIPRPRIRNDKSHLKVCDCVSVRHWLRADKTQTNPAYNSL